MNNPRAWPELNYHVAYAAEDAPSRPGYGFFASGAATNANAHFKYLVDTTAVMAAEKRNIVIVGGGVIGCTTAYYLTRHPNFDPELHKITLLEATAIAAGASGKAGGLLGLWARPACIVPLSYKLHGDLAREHGGAERWGYRRLECGSLEAVVTEQDLNLRKLKAAAGTEPAAKVAQPPAQDGKEDAKYQIEWERLPKQDERAAALLKKSVVPQDLDYIQADLVRSYAEMGEPGTTETAQVHPFLFTTAIAELAQQKGVDIRLGAKVTKINYTKTEVQSVEYEDRERQVTHTIEGVTDIVVSAGPWTGRLLPKTKVEGLRAHSVVFEANVNPYAVFTEIELPPEWTPDHRARRGQRRKHRGIVDPEIYARPNNEVYACGTPDSSAPLPDTADLVQVNVDECDDMIAYIGIVSPVLGAAPIKAKQACYLPQHIRFGRESHPLVGKTSVPGLWVASGHTCWGIQNGPGTGFLMAEYLLEGEAKSADVSQLDPRSFKV
ncbi:FAD dependent oxidoreductase [Thozetella sp. PMI_491]|nr:FAD dependent oxidoreductase [Thozetella sp. PMI_491]